MGSLLIALGGSFLLVNLSKKSEVYLAVIPHFMIQPKKVDEFYGFIKGKFFNNKSVNRIVLISPNTSYKGLYIPVAITELGNTAFLCVASDKDNGAIQAEQTLRKFAQADFEVYNVPRNGSGMMLLNQNPELSDMIIKWIDKYLKSSN